MFLYININVNYVR